MVTTRKKQSHRHHKARSWQVKTRARRRGSVTRQRQRRPVSRKKREQFLPRTAGPRLALGMTGLMKKTLSSDRRNRYEHATIDIVRASYRARPARYWDFKKW